MNAALIPALLWSLLMASSFVVSAWITAFAPPLSVTFLRFLLALLIMTPVYFAMGGRLSRLFRSRKECLTLFVVSGCLVGFFVCLFTALTSTTSLNTSVLYTLVPLIGACLSVLMGVKTARRQWLGFLTGSVGAITVLFFANISQFQWHSGDAVYLCGCVLLACHVVAAQRWCAHYSPFGGAYRIMLCGTIWLLPITLVSGQLTVVQWQVAEFWQMLAWLTLATTLLTFVLQQQVLISGGAGMLLGASYVIPVWVACYSALNDSSMALLSPGFITGSALIVTAQWLIGARNRNKEDRRGQSVPETTV